MKVATKVEGSTRHFWFDGVKYTVRPNLQAIRNPGQDAWEYALPDGRVYTHPTREGCLILILKHLGGDEWSNPPE